jgi:hypothetical protein
VTKRDQRPPRRRRLGPTLGGVTVSWRWEVGLPMFVIGTVMALAVIATDMTLVFWIGVLIAGVGASIFFSGLTRR